MRRTTPFEPLEPVEPIEPINLNPEPLKVSSSPAVAAIGCGASAAPIPIFFFRSAGDIHEEEGIILIRQVEVFFTR